jgi:hypothetical protein
VAKEVVTRLIDDIDGGVAHETVTFEIDGSLYKIDLSSKNAKKLRAELATYVSHGNRVSARGPAAAARPPGRRAGAAVVRDQSRAIRAWAQRKGFDVASRGRIRQEIVEEYHRNAGR